MNNILDLLHTARQRVQMLLVWRIHKTQVQERLQILAAAGVFARSANVAELVQQYSSWCGIPIRLVPTQFRANIDAMVVPRRDHFTIYFSQSVHPLTGMHAIRHEIAHIDLGDVVLSPDDSSEDELTDRDLIRSLKRETFEHPQEVRAECWAYLAQRLWQRDHPHVHSPLGLTDDAGALAWQRFETYMAPLDPPEG